MNAVESESDIQPTANPALSHLASAGILVFIAGFLFLLYWNIYADRYRPIVSPDIPLFPYGAVVGGLLFVLLFVGVKLRSSKTTVLTDNGEADHSVEDFFAAFGIHPIVFALGMMILGGIFSQAWAWTLNAWCDQSPVQVRNIEVLGRTITTHKAIFRSYELKYRFVDDPKGETHIFKCSNAEFESCDQPFVRIETQQGAFGWPWVRTVEPLETDKP
jgi:hypothetical protein